MANIKNLLFLIFLLIQFIYSKGKMSKQTILYVGTTGDYKPVSFYNKTTNTYEGIDIELSELYAKEHNLKIKFIPTTWPNLLEDTMNNKFDFANLWYNYN